MRHFLSAAEIINSLSSSILPSTITGLGSTPPITIFILLELNKETAVVKDVKSTASRGRSFLKIVLNTWFRGIII